MIKIENKVMSQEEVENFFPQNVYKLFEKTKEQISFFGIHSNGRDIEGEKLIGKYQNFDLMILDSKPEVSFLESSSRWIRNEHEKVKVLKKEYNKELYGKYPLLKIILISHYTNPENNFIFMNLIRYADHDRFRKNWIGKKVLDSISRELKKRGVKYLYLDNRINRWNDKYNERFGLIERHDLPIGDLKKIASCFPDETVESLGKHSNYSHLIRKL